MQIVESAPQFDPEDDEPLIKLTSKGVAAAAAAATTSPAAPSADVENGRSDEKEGRKKKRRRKEDDDIEARFSQCPDKRESIAIEESG